MMEQEIKEPKDLGVKIGTKEQVLWENVLKGAKVQIEKCEAELIVQKEVVLLANRKIKQEKEKMAATRS